MTPVQRRTMRRELAVIAAIIWLIGWLVLNSDTEAVINLFVGASLMALYRLGA